jgi:hypothetical protein
VNIKPKGSGGETGYFRGNSAVNSPEQSRLLNFGFVVATFIVLVIAVLVIMFSLTAQPVGAAPESLYWCLGGC